MSFWQRQLARLNFLPCIFLLVNFVGLPIGVWAILGLIHGTSSIPATVVGLSIVNIVGYSANMIYIYRATWRRSALVLKTRRERLKYMWRINPIFLWIWWFI
jgi:glycosyltransferase XagB